MGTNHLTSQEKAIRDAAKGYARKNKKLIAKRLTNPEVYCPEDEPVSVFMAGSPGAGKTETSQELIAQLASDGCDILRIDPDELRNEFTEYDGTNAWLFQPAVSILVEKIHDIALKQGQSFILDGTLANYDKAKDNIDRSLNKQRIVQILYVYQDPLQAWSFVQAREASEGRRILPEHFIDQYFDARDVVNRLKTHYKKAISVDLLIKNIDNSHRAYVASIDQIDNHVPEKYTRSHLVSSIKLD